MTDSVRGALGPIYLAGHLLDKVAVGDQDFTTVEQRETVTLGRGATREALAYQGAGCPMVGVKHRLGLPFTNLGTQYDLVEELLAVPGPYDVVTWRRAHPVYAGDGDRATFYLPWYATLDFYTVPGMLFSALTGGQLSTEVAVGDDPSSATSLAVVPKDQADYDAGEPDTDEAWFLNEGQEFKVGAPPEFGERLYLRYVPILSMFKEAAPQSRRYQPGGVREPLDLALVEQ